MFTFTGTLIVLSNVDWVKNMQNDDGHLAFYATYSMLASFISKMGCYLLF